MSRITGIRLATLAFAITLTGCSTVTPPSTKPEKPIAQISWKDRQAALERLRNWQLNGKIAIQTAQDAGSATVDWIQNRSSYQISLYGPLGSHGIKLAGQPGHVTLDTSDGKHFTANNAEQLLAKNWGWNLPVSNLTYWVRGLPVPTSTYSSHFDNSNRLTSLQQQGWNVQFLGYTNEGAIDLPSKISITSATFKTKIVIYQWKTH